MTCWGVQSADPGALNWVRPLHSIVATFGPETEEPDIVPFAIDGIAAGNEDSRVIAFWRRRRSRCGGWPTYLEVSTRRRRGATRRRRKTLS